MTNFSARISKTERRKKENFSCATFYGYKSLQTSFFNVAEVTYPQAEFNDNIPAF